MDDIKQKSNVGKPLTIAHRDFVSNLTNLINNCQLPAFVIETILRDFYNDVRHIAAEQLENDLKKYSKDGET